jgi:hypothetical protein
MYGIVFVLHFILKQFKKNFQSESITKKEKKEKEE